MKIIVGKLHRIISVVTAIAAIFCYSGLSPMSVQAAEKQNSSVFAGAGALLSPNGKSTDIPAADAGGKTAAASGNQGDASSSATAESDEGSADKPSGDKNVEKEEKPAEEKSDFFMADVNEVMNVRTEPDPESEKIGVLYKDCGGTILERGDGWTKIKSGDLVGWANNDYLLFGDEAKKLAADVGQTIAIVQTDSLRVRKEPDTDSGILDLLKNGSEYEVTAQDDGSGFVKINYKGKAGYVSSDYVKLDFRVDKGETLEAIRKREEAERQRKAKLTANQGAVKTTEDEIRLLAALVQCEAGNQPYEGQLGVAAVVMNRVRSGGYPNTVSGVVYASGQFGPAASGQVADTYNGKIKESCMLAAQAAMAGQTSVGGACHFKPAGSHEGTVIGGHVFW